jgi:hypothetical protein
VREADRNEPTLVNEQLFQMMLPGQWQSIQTHDESRFIYQDRTGREQLTVSVFSLAPGLTEEQRRGVAERMLAKLRESEREVRGTSCRLSPVGYGRSGDVLAARYTGNNQGTGRRFASLLLCSSYTTANFYYEAFELTEEQFEERARYMMNSIELRRY